jgi:hypothetical protein
MPTGPKCIEPLPWVPVFSGAIYLQESAEDAPEVDNDLDYEPMEEEEESISLAE